MTTRRLPRSRRTALVLTVAAVAAVGGCTSGSSSSGGSTAASAATAGTAGTAGTATPGANAAGPADALQNEYQRTIKAVLPSIVQITAQNRLGSGVVYDTKGDIVTNAHVLGSATAFTVTLADSSKTLPAKLVASYPPNDLAVIRLDNPPGNLKPASFADSSKVQVGQIVLAMGNPLGLESSVTQGIVSAVGRTVSEPAASNGAPGAAIPNMVQTSAAINPGNSGGALVNLDDQVVGINTLAAVSSESGSQAPGIGFAIPAATVADLADQIIKQGKVTNSGRAALGITTRTVLAGTAGAETGAGVVSVKSGGPADKAGLRPGDVIIKLGSTPVPDVGALSLELAKLQPGQQVQVTYLRDGATRTATVTLGTL